MHKEGPRYEPDKQDKIDTIALNISAFGDYLFRLHHNKHDWATNIRIVVGTKSVRKWLADNKSLAAFNRISHL